MEDELIEGEIYSELSWSGQKIVDKTFRKCQLSSVKLEGTRFQDVVFSDCKFTVLDFYKCDPMLFSIRFDRCFFLGCNFSGFNLKGTSFQGCRFEMCAFVETKLEGADFSECQFKESPFHQCDLQRANFINAVGFGIDPLSCKLRKAKFSPEGALSLAKAFEIDIV